MVLFGQPGAGRSPRGGGTGQSFGRPQNEDGTWAGHVFNLGHGISQFTPPDSVTALVERSTGTRVSSGPEPVFRAGAWRAPCGAKVMRRG